MTTGLNREEQETIINFNKGESIASVFAYEQRWQKHLEEKLGLKPIKDNGFGGKEYELDKCLVRMPQPKHKREITKEERGRLLARLRSKDTAQ